jgi:hypothetical protein
VSFRNSERLGRSQESIARRALHPVDAFAGLASPALRDSYACRAVRPSEMGIRPGTFVTMSTGRRLLA